MYTFLLILLILDSLLLIGVVLLQSGKGGGLAASFGGVSSSAEALFGSRQAGNLLTQASWWCGGIFVFLAFVLQIASTRSRGPRSVLDKPFTQTQQQPPTSPVPGATPNAPATAVPLTPAPAAPAEKGNPKPAPAPKKQP